MTTTANMLWRCEGCGAPIVSGAYWCWDCLVNARDRIPDGGVPAEQEG